MSKFTRFVQDGNVCFIKTSIISLIVLKDHYFLLKENKENKEQTKVLFDEIEIEGDSYGVENEIETTDFIAHLLKKGVPFYMIKSYEHVIKNEIRSRGLKSVQMFFDKFDLSLIESENDRD